MRRAIVTLSVAPVFGSFKRQEDVGPGVVATELGDLPLHPQSGQPTEVHPDAAVERRDREDLAVAVDEVLDLRHLARVSPPLDPAAPARKYVLDRVSFKRGART